MKILLEFWREVVFNILFVEEKEMLNSKILDLKSGISKKLGL